ncbi:MAG: tetratricopeptide repeat protein [Thermodesulfobacteriota bacterium]
MLAAVAVPMDPWTMREAKALAMSPEPSPTERPDVEPAPHVEPSLAEWMQKAVDGNLEAQCNVGVRYVNGQGVPRDYGAGIAWLYVSANGGFSYAQYVLGLLYGQGFGNTPADPFRSWFWSALAVAKGDLPPSEMNLAEKLRDAAQKQLSLADLNRAQAMAREWWAGRVAGPR